MSPFAASTSLSGSATRATPATAPSRSKGTATYIIDCSERRARALAGALAGRESVHAPRDAPGVVVHAWHVDERDVRVAEDQAVGADERHAGVGRAPERVRESVPRLEVVRQRGGEARGLARDESRASEQADARRLAEPAARWPA